MGDSVEDRLQRIEDTLAIQQLPVRYAMAIDERDLDAWVALFVPDVRVGRDTFGREALRKSIASMAQVFYRSIHQIVGHRIDLIDAENATGSVYCRAEHEVGDEWIVMAIRYGDTYRKVDGHWHFSRRKERHWYAADVTQRPQAVDFAGWSMAGRTNLPRSQSWQEFWAQVDVTFGDVISHRQRLAGFRRGSITGRQGRRGHRCGLGYRTGLRQRDGAQRRFGGGRRHRDGYGASRCRRSTPRRGRRWRATSTILRTPCRRAASMP